MKYEIFIQNNVIVGIQCDGMGFQSNLFPKTIETDIDLTNLLNNDGIPLYKYINGRITERTPEEIQADIAEIPVPPPTPEQIDRADIDYLLMMIGE